jgi:hypothetical protein
MTPSSFNMIAILSLLLLHLASSFAPFPVHERGYSVQSLEDYCEEGCTNIINKKEIPPKTLFDFIRNKFDNNEIDFMRNFEDLMPYTNGIYTSAAIMIACLSPYESNTTAEELSCPFDPQVTLLVQRDVVNDAKAELRRIQQVASLVKQLNSDIRAIRYERDIAKQFKDTFRAHFLYFRASLLDHSSQPSLKAVWDTVCNAPLKFGSIDQPAERSHEDIPEISYAVLIDAACETMIVQSFFTAFVIMGLFEGILIHLHNPLQCRIVRLVLNFNCLNRLAGRLVRSSF